MGLIATLNVFSLVAVPMSLLCKGYDLPWRLVISATILGLVVEIGRLLAVEALTLRQFPALGVFAAVVSRCMDVAVVYCVLQSAVVRKHFEVTTRDRSASLAVGMSAAHAVLNNIGPLYTSANSPGFEADVLLGAVVLNTRLLMLLSAVASLSTRQVSAATLVVVALVFCASDSANVLGVASQMDHIAVGVIGWLVILLWRCVLCREAKDA